MTSNIFNKKRAMSFFIESKLKLFIQRFQFPPESTRYNFT